MQHYLNQAFLMIVLHIEISHRESVPLMLVMRNKKCDSSWISLNCLQALKFLNYKKFIFKLQQYTFELQQWLLKLQQCRFEV